MMDQLVPVELKMYKLHWCGWGQLALAKWMMAGEKVRSDVGIVLCCL